MLSNDEAVYGAFGCATPGVARAAHRGSGMTDARTRAALRFAAADGTRVSKAGIRPNGATASAVSRPPTG